MKRLVAIALTGLMTSALLAQGAAPKTTTAQKGATTHATSAKAKGHAATSKTSAPKGHPKTEAHARRTNRTTHHLDHPNGTTAAPSLTPAPAQPAK